MQTFQRRACSRNHLLFWLSYLGPWSSHPSHPKARCQTLRENPSTSEPTELIQTNQSQSCSRCLTSPTVKTLASPSLSPPASWYFPCAPLGMVCPLLWGTVSSVPQSCLTLCDLMDCSTPGLPVHHQLLELAQTQRSLSW